MSFTDEANSEIHPDYDSPLDADEVSKTQSGVLPTGIIEGFEATQVSSTDVEIEPGVVGLRDIGRDNWVRVSTSANVTLQPTETEPYMIVRWERNNEEGWNEEYATVGSVGSGDIVIAEGEFDSGSLVGVSYADRDYAQINYRLDLQDEVRTYGVIRQHRTLTSDTTLGKLDDIVGVDTSSNAVTVNLPSSEEGKEYVVKDEAGNAQTNNIKIRPAVGTIDGSTSYTIDRDYGSLDLYFDGADWNILAERTGA